MKVVLVGENVSLCDTERSRWEHCNPDDTTCQLPVQIYDGVSVSNQQKFDLSNDGNNMLCLVVKKAILEDAGTYQSLVLKGEDIRKTSTVQVLGCTILLFC